MTAGVCRPQENADLPFFLVRVSFILSFKSLVIFGNRNGLASAFVRRHLDIS